MYGQVDDKTSNRSHHLCVPWRLTEFSIQVVHKWWGLTLWVSEKAQQCDAIAMGPSDIIMNISNRDIERPGFVLPSCDRDGSFVTTENNQNKCWSMAQWLLCNHILWVSWRSVKWKELVNLTHSLLPGPISRHKVFILVIIVLIMLLKWCVIKSPIEIRVGK